MKALIDGDILRYEVGFGAETGWKAITGRDELPPFDYVRQLLDERIEQIRAAVDGSDCTIYLSEGKSFRDRIAVSRPYKGHRIQKRPYHYANLTTVLRDLYPTVVVQGIEADDAMSIQSTLSPGEYIICSRDKDLRQVPGWFFSWELGKQASVGPIEINPMGTLQIDDLGTKKVLTGTGFAWFCAQLLTGDVADNIPGLPGWGPVKAYEQLSPDVGDNECLFHNVQAMYLDEEGMNEDYLLEQGQLLWMVRRYKDDGSPELWSLGQYE